MAFLEFDRTRPGALPSIQILRGAAAALVVFSHVLRIVEEQWTSSGATYLPAISFGDLGVFAFFVVSGFIMYHTAGRDFGSAELARRFLLKRLIRIVPLYWASTAATLILPFTYGWRPASLPGAALSFAFLPDVTNPPSLLPVLPVGWTLSFEMLFYLVFAACLAAPRRIGLALLFAAFPAFLAAVVILGRSTAATQGWWAYVPWWARIHLLLFVFGVGLAMIQERFGRVVDRFGLGLWAALALIVATPVAALTLHVALSPQTEALIAVVSVALGAMSVGHAWERVTPLVRLGDASYVLYLGHSAVLGGLSMVWLALFGPRLPVAFGLLAVAASCAIAWPLHRWIEKPITRRLRLLLEPKPHAVMVLSRSANIPAA